MQSELGRPDARESPRGSAEEEATCILRPMTEEDVDQVASIELEAFATPWKAEAFRSLINRDNVVTLVLELSEGEILGYAVLWCVLEQGELANLAIRETHRGQGLGSRLLDEVLAVARSKAVQSLYLEVRASNHRAAALYAQRGFVEIGRRKGYYDRPREDARVLMRRLT